MVVFTVCAGLSYVDVLRVRGGEACRRCGGVTAGPRGAVTPGRFPTRATPTQ